MNNTFLVASMYKCEDILDDLNVYRPDIVWRTTRLGCQLLHLLQEMYIFQMTYTRGFMLYDPSTNATMYSKAPDIYARPLSLTLNSIKFGNPLPAVINRRYGFVLRRANKSIIRRFFTLPFSTTTWYCLCMMILVITLVLYLLCCWEKRIAKSRKEEYSFSYELLVVIGACCQHIPPIAPVLTSRRIGYLTCFLFNYLIYSFYTSNLLSHLVNDRDTTMTLSELIDNSYKLKILENIQLNASKRFNSTDPHFTKIEELRKKHAHNHVEIVNVSVGLKAVATEDVALLSDYITLYPFMEHELSNEVICGLAEIDIFTNIKENLFTSKSFPLYEQFKIGILRIKETGILKMLKQDHLYAKPRCQSNHETPGCFSLIIGPLIILLASYALSFILLMMERAHFDKNRVWPYRN